MERQAGRTTRLLGALLLAIGSVTMVGALVTPAGADPGNGHAYGHNKNGSAIVTDPAPSGPQADNGNGANQDCGAYCPSGVGLPSGNGNGDGNATGEPCAGCVGNADGKNPPGQAPDGSDHNNGYECDGNNGIGKTNPAHSGCHPTTTTVPKTTTTTDPCLSNNPPASCSTTTTIPQSTTTTAAPCTGEGCPTTTTVAPCIGDHCGTTTTTIGASVLGESFTRPNAGSPASTGPLAFTGGVVGKLFVAGLAMALMGIVIMAHRSRGLLRSNN